VKKDLAPQEKEEPEPALLAWPVQERLKEAVRSLELKRPLVVQPGSARRRRAEWASKAHPCCLRLQPKAASTAIEGVAQVAAAWGARPVLLEQQAPQRQVPRSPAQESQPQAPAWPLQMLPE